jgi:phosphoribosyl 1,2-cyclic phosphodiesterase
MKIHCLASSSRGNSYIIKNEQDTLLVEAGLDFSTLKSRLTSLNIKLSDIDAVVITHKHGDHLHKKTVERLGQTIPVISNKDVLSSVNVEYGWLAEIMKPVTIKSFKIYAFELEHDVETYGYIIEDQEESLLFINDTKLVRWNFNKYTFDKVMIECNHMHDRVKDMPRHRQRSVKSHMSLKATIKTLENLNLNDTQAIYLMHMSDGYSNQNLMVKEVEKATGIPTYACLRDGGFS